MTSSGTFDDIQLNSLPDSAELEKLLQQGDIMAGGPSMGDVDEMSQGGPQSVSQAHMVCPSNAGLQQQQPRAQHLTLLQSPAPRQPQHQIQHQQAAMMAQSPQNQARQQNTAKVEITEQPKARGLRFRYECEGRSAGSILGENSTNEQRTFPSIKIANYSGQSAVVLVSCVTKDNPPKPHPHSLVGKDCSNGVCTVKLRGTNEATFPNLGIQCAKKKDVVEALKTREKVRVDPFQTGFAHKDSTIDLNVVRLCFQVFLPDEQRKYTRILQPVVSQCIYDKKAVNDLVICRISRPSGYARGGDEVFLLCEKVNKDDIQIRFYEDSEDGVIRWEAFGEFGQSDVHRQVAIVFKTPPYRDITIRQPRQVYIQLKRTSDGEVSEPKAFQYMPDDRDPEGIDEKRKRKRVAIDSFLQDQKSVLPPTSSHVIKERLKLRAQKNRIKQEKVDALSCTAPVGKPKVTSFGAPPSTADSVPPHQSQFSFMSQVTQGVQFPPTTATMTSAAENLQAANQLAASVGGGTGTNMAGSFHTGMASNGILSSSMVSHATPISASQDPQANMDSASLLENPTAALSWLLDGGGGNTLDPEFLQRYLSEDPSNSNILSFPETEQGLSGDLAHLDYDPNIAANENVSCGDMDTQSSMAKDLSDLQRQLADLNQ